MKALLLAAGMGQRLRPHTLHRAKPSLPFLGLPLLSYPLSLLESLPSLEEVIVNTHHCPATIHAALKSVAPHIATSISYSHEANEILGSGGAIQNRKGELLSEEPFLVANADELLFLDHPEGLLRLIEAHKSSGALASLLTCQHPEAGKSFGAAWCNDKNEIEAFGKTQPAPHLRPMHFTGFQIFSPRIFKFLPQGVSHIFLDAVVPAIKQGEKVLSFEEKNVRWWETGDENSFLQSTRECLNSLDQNSILQSHLEKYHEIQGPLTQIANGLWSCSPQTHADLDFRGFLCHNSKVHPSAQIKGFLVLGENSSVGPNVQIENVVIGANMKITANLKNQLKLT